MGQLFSNLNDDSGGTPTTSEPKLPYNYATIVSGGTKPAIAPSSDNKTICQQLHSGVFLNEKKMKYWIDKNNNNCFMVLARSLNIIWGQDNRYWHWFSLKESSGCDEYIEVAELLDVCWLEVSGTIETEWLSPGVKYEVCFVVMFKDPAYGWEVPVTLVLNLPPDEQKQEKRLDLMGKPKGQWMDLTVGAFTTTQKDGQIKFQLLGYEGGNWRKGLVIKGVMIRPTN